MKENNKKSKMKEFFKGLKAEFKKITWTPKKKLFSLFKTTFIATTVITLSIFLVDTLFSYIVTSLINLL